MVRHGGGAMKKYEIILGALFVIALISVHSRAGRAETEPCRDVYVGGTIGFEQLAEPSNVGPLRGNSRIGLYMHASGMQLILNEHKSKAINEAFDGKNGGVAELGEFSSSWFSSMWRVLFTSQGFHPQAANVNVNSGNFNAQFSTADLAHFDDFLTAARGHGMTSFAPVVTPNGGKEVLVWSDSFWDNARKAALHGGGIAIDAPPAYVFGRGATYLAFIEDEIRWGIQNRLRTAYIVSPYSDGPQFLLHTQNLVRALTTSHALPTEWDVENYEADESAATKDMMNTSNRPDKPNAIATVALWLAEHAQTDRHSIAACHN
jgi:hypothetical protein